MTFKEVFLVFVIVLVVHAGSDYEVTNPFTKEIKGHAKYALTNFAVIHGKHVYVLKKVRYAKKQQNKKNYILGIEYSHKKNGVVLCIEAKMEYKKNSARPTTSFKACATEGEVYG